MVGGGSPSWKQANEKKEEPGVLERDYVLMTHINQLYPAVSDARELCSYKSQHIPSFAQTSYS